MFFRTVWIICQALEKTQRENKGMRLSAAWERVRERERGKMHVTFT